MQSTASSSTQDRILDHAQLLVQTVGFNGFSYADIAEVVSLRKATIHHYFPTKAILCAEMLKRYRNRFRESVALSTQDARTVKSRIKRYAALYQQSLQEGRLCPCGVLSGELATLAPEVRAEVKDFFDEQLDWLKGQISEAQDLDQVISPPSARQLALTFFSVIEGAMLLARAKNDERLLADAVGAYVVLLFP